MRKFWKFLEKFNRNLMGTLKNFLKHSKQISRTFPPLLKKSLKFSHRVINYILLVNSNCTSPPYSVEYRLPRHPDGGSPTGGGEAKCHLLR